LRYKGVRMTDKYKIYAGTLLLSLLTACGGSSNVNGVEQPLVCGTGEPTPIDEGGIGDFSNDPENPRVWALAPGANNLLAGTESGDPDYVAFTVDACDTLDSITLNAFNADTGDTEVSISIQIGSTFDSDPLANTTSELVGFASFGTALVSEDLLALAAQDTASTGLGPGTYTLFLSNPAETAEYTLVFDVSRVLMP